MRNKHKIRVTIQASLLEDDVGVLLRAHTIVGGAGTFAHAIALLSPNVRRLFLPRYSVIADSEGTHQMHAETRSNTCMPFDLQLVDVPNYYESCVKATYKNHIVDFVPNTPITHQQWHQAQWNP